MRVLICGDRNWADSDAILAELAVLNGPNEEIDVVIHGGARGADELAGEAAAIYHIPVEVYPANWKEFGRAAGPIRNKQMLAEGKPDIVLAFHSDIENSKGTKNMVNQARKAGIETRIIDA